jgi:hypothetical protein
MTQPNLNPCDEPGYIKDLNIDSIQPFCSDKEPSLKNVPDRELSWLIDEMSNKKKGHGQSALCDPVQAGHIINEQGMSPPNRNVLYRYSKSLRGCDEGVMDMFRDLVVIDEQGKAHNVPIIWATQEKAVAAILQDNVRKDESLVVDRIKLPILAINSTGYNFNQGRYVYHKAVDYLRTNNRDWKPGFTVKEKYERDTVFGVASGIPVDVTYTLYAWTLYEEDMKQILEQIFTKFSPMAYIRVKGVSWEIGVKLDSLSSNINSEPGDKAVRVIKYNIQMTAESYVSQPIIRKKAVLKTKVDLIDTVDTDTIGDVISRLEQAVEELSE